MLAPQTSAEGVAMRPQQPQWERETRVCGTIGLDEHLLQALRACIELHEMGPVEAQALVCFETLSRRTRKAGLLMKMAGAGMKTMTQAVVVTPTRLVWVQREDEGTPHAHWEWLTQLDVHDYEKGPEAGLIPDHGLQIHGIKHQGRVGTVFFGLGEGPDADHARQVLKEAVRTAHGEGAAGGLETNPPLPEAPPAG
jgi:hypothetical protein